MQLRSPYPETIVGWIDWSGRIMVGAYRLDDGIRHTHVLGRLFHDDHGSPSILVEPDHRLTVFWSAHNGARVFFRTSSAPGEVTRWGRTRTLPDHVPGPLGFTYPSPEILPAEHNRLYLFWRGADWSADVATRSASGRWGPTRVLIRNRGQRPYLKVDSNGRDTIALAFTDAHPRDALTSVYYLGLRRGWLRGADGRLIERLGSGPVASQSADVVYDATRTGISGWVWDVAFAHGGHPVILYATFPSATRHLYWYARFNGARWVSHLLGVAGPTISPSTLEREYSGGMALDHGDPSIVYLSRKFAAHFEIDRWVTHDGGNNWTHGRVVRGKGVDELRPVVARGSHGGPLSLLWLSGHYGTYTTYRTWVDFLH